MASDGRVGSELCRRIGGAKADFSALRRVWSRAPLGRQRKVAIYKALVESKLLYGLAAACFTKAELRRLDGFQSKCLREVLGIKASFYSRVSNATVRAQAQSEAASDALRRAQLMQLGKVMRASKDNPLFATSFVGATWRPTVDYYVRRVGRPRKEWVPDVLAEGARRAGGVDKLAALANSTPQAFQQLLLH